MKYNWLYLLVMLIFSDCERNHEELVCFHVEKSDYTEKITVNGTVQAVNTTYIKAPRMFLSTIIWLEEDGNYVEKGDTVCILEHPETQGRLESFLNEMEKMEAQLEKIESDHNVKIAMLQADIENNEIQLSINSLDSIQKKFAPPLQQRLISLEQQKAMIIKEKLEKKLVSQKTIGETEIRGLRSRIKQMENRIERTKDELSDLILTAPKAGLLIRPELPTLFFMTGNGYGSIGGKIKEGSQTWTNMNILEIPNLEKMQVMAELSENDYKKVEEGQRVIIKVDAKNNLITSGSIKQKMLTGKQKNRDSKVKTYEAIIEVDSCHKQLTPGLNAECDIIINEFEDTLVIPAIAVFEEKDDKYVYVREEKKYRRTPVETGVINGTYCVISGGLTSGSHIALSKPPSGRIIRENDSNTASKTEKPDSLEQEIPGNNDSLHLVQSKKNLQP